jgi:hypothetical protein
MVVRYRTELIEKLIKGIGRHKVIVWSCLLINAAGPFSSLTCFNQFIIKRIQEFSSACVNKKVFQAVVCF